MTPIRIDTVLPKLQEYPLFFVPYATIVHAVEVGNQIRKPIVTENVEGKTVEMLIAVIAQRDDASTVIFAIAR